MGIADQVVVLVHGIWCLSAVMWYLAWKLRRQGYTVHCFSYASVLGDFDRNVEAMARKIDSVRAPVLHLVAHSYGGLVLTELLDRRAVRADGRMVLLGSPVRGAQLAAGVMQGRFRWRLLGRAAQSPLVNGIAAQKLARVAITREVGVISGTRNRTLLGLIFGRLSSGDGLVAPHETDFPGAQTAQVSVSHAGLLFSAAVADKVSQFIRSGQF